MATHGSQRWALYLWPMAKPPFSVMINHIILWKARGKEEEEPFCPLLLVFLFFLPVWIFPFFLLFESKLCRLCPNITMQHLIVNTITVAQCTFLWLFMEVVLYFIKELWMSPVSCISIEWIWSSTIHYETVFLMFIGDQCICLVWKTPRSSLSY